jgi:hypothetical protein
MFFWTMFLHNFTLTCSKLSLLVQFLRFFQEGKTAKACWCGIVVVAINAIMQFLLNIFHCYPVSTFWEKQLVSDHRRACLDYATLFYPGSIGNVITSLMVFIIPMPKIWSLPLQRKAKVSLFLIFGFGFL